MTKIAMPEPAAWAHFTRDGLIQVWSRRKTDVASLERLMKKCPDALITTTQAEAYADARVREALEEAAQACEARIGQHAPGMMPEDVEDCDEEARMCADAIRALIKQPA